MALARLRPTDEEAADHEAPEAEAADGDHADVVEDPAQNVVRNHAGESE